MDVPLAVTANQCCFIGFGARCFAESGFRLSIRAIRDQPFFTRRGGRGVCRSPSPRKPFISRTTKFCLGQAFCKTVLASCARAIPPRNASVGRATESFFSIDLPFAFPLYSREWTLSTKFLTSICCMRPRGTFYEEALPHSERTERPARHYLQVALRRRVSNLRRGSGSCLATHSSTFPRI